jgi:hypothetical protein
MGATVNSPGRRRSRTRGRSARTKTQAPGWGRP